MPFRINLKRNLQYAVASKVVLCNKDAGIDKPCQERKDAIGSICDRYTRICDGYTGFEDGCAKCEILHIHLQILYIHHEYLLIYQIFVHFW